MFNQKVNHFISDNPKYELKENAGYRPGHVNINNCRITANKYKLSNSNTDLPLQTWTSKNVAVEMFAMRPIVNSKEYFENIRKYLSSIVYEDNSKIISKKLHKNEYTLLESYGVDPITSFLQTIRVDVIDRLNDIMGNSCDKIDMFKNYNPINEGFVITDINIISYISKNDSNIYFHKVTFSAVNTTRYNTVSFKASVYQDTSSIMNKWNDSVNKLQNSEDLPINTNINSKTDIYISNIDLLNNIDCTLGNEEDCLLQPYSFNNKINNNNLINSNNLNKWLNTDSLEDNSYNIDGSYELNGEIKIKDNGPDDIDNLIKELGNTYSRTNSYL